MESNKSVFFENSNFYLLYNILKNDLSKKFKYNLDDSQGKVKLFEIMNNIYTQNSDYDLKKLNMMSLRSAAPVLKNLCADTNTKKTDNSFLERDMILQKKVPEFINMRPEYLVKTSKDLDTAYQDVNDRYTTKKPKPIDFSLPFDNNQSIDIENYKIERENNVGGSTDISEIIEDNMSSDISNLHPQKQKDDNVF